MHPMMIMALANQVQRERRNQQLTPPVRPSAQTDPGRGSDSTRAVSGLARRLIEGISLRPRLS